jgi:hypothetical protein
LPTSAQDESSLTGIPRQDRAARIVPTKVMRYLVTGQFENTGLGSMRR